MQKQIGNGNQHGLLFSFYNDYGIILDQIDLTGANVGFTCKFKRLEYIIAKVIN